MFKNSQMFDELIYFDGFFYWVLCMYFRIQFVGIIQKRFPIYSLVPISLFHHCKSCRQSSRTNIRVTEHNQRDQLETDQMFIIVLYWYSHDGRPLHGVMIAYGCNAAVSALWRTQCIAAGSSWLATVNSQQKREKGSYIYIQKILSFRRFYRPIALKTVMGLVKFSAVIHLPPFTVHDRIHFLRWDVFYISEEQKWTVDGSQQDMLADEPGRLQLPLPPAAAGADTAQCVSHSDWKLPSDADFTQQCSMIRSTT